MFCTFAQAHGAAYRPAAELGRDDIAKLLARIDYLERKVLTGDADAVEALVAAPDAPPILIDELYDRFLEHTRDRVRGKSADQLRRWQNPRIKVQRDFLALGLQGRPIASLTRADLLAFRAALLQDVLDGEITAETANKYIAYLRGMLRTETDAYALPMPPAEKLGLEGDLGGQRVAYPVAFIRERLLDPSALAGLNAEARRVVYAMVETGMRVSEVVNIAPEHIHLGADIPHLTIRATETRRLKNKHSAHDIPLVGVSLQAFQAQPEGFPEYRDREASLSGTVNKFLAENGLRPEAGQSLYSLRHSFEDRLQASGADDRTRAQLMGHAYKRPAYGEGLSLSEKRRLLDAIALPSLGAV